MANYNKFKSCKINDMDNIGYALTISGNVLMNNDNNVYIQSNLVKKYNGKKYLTEDDLYGDNNNSINVGFNNVAVGGNIETGNLLCSNCITTIYIKANNLNVFDLYVNGVKYKNHQNVGNFYIGNLNNLCLSLSNGTIYDTTTYYQNLNLQTYLQNNNNNVLLNPNYMLVFYNYDNILQIIDNTNGINILYNNISLNFLCTKILIYYKNVLI